MGLGGLFGAGMLIARMKRNQWLSRGELESIQGERLRRLVEYARRNVPYYRKAFAGLPPVRSLEDLQSLPITGKESVKLDADSFISGKNGAARDPGHLNRMNRMYTSGSGGVPLGLYFDRRDGAYGAALRYHTLTECGFGPADTLANMTHTSFQRFPLQDFIYRIRNIPPGRSEEEILRDFASSPGASRPSMLFAYPSTLSIMAGQNAQRKQPLRIPRAVSCSERLSPAARRLIGSSFGCQVRDYYGASESWSLAWECGHGSLHVNSDSVIVEVVGRDGKPARPGERGEILVTSLWRYSMPFIRYRIGDTASPGGSCACGRGLHVLQSLDGRSADVVVLPSGRPISWSLVQSPLCSMEGIMRFQCIQESEHRLRFLVIPMPGSDSIADSVRRAVEGALPERMEISVERVGSIPRLPSGKMPDFVSRMPGLPRKRNPASETLPPKRTGNI